MIKNIVQLECMHVLYFHNPAPRIGETLWCIKCRKDVKVESAPDEWRSKCRDCGYNRLHGASQLTAEVAATKHRRRYGSHVVVLYNGKKQVRTFDGRGAETTQGSDQPMF